MQAVGLFRSCEDIKAIRGTNLLALLLLPNLCLKVLRSRTENQNQTCNTRCSEYNPRIRDSSIGCLTAYACAMIPPLWFVGFLYYTDVLGLYAVLAALAAAESGKHIRSSIWGLVSLLFRQTNIIWVLFIVGVAIVNVSQRISETPRQKSPPFFALLTRCDAWIHWGHTLAPYIPTFLAFAAYVIWNDGAIVLGDKNHHEVAFHATQLNYFSAFTLAFAWPLLSVPRCCRSQYYAYLALLVLSTLAVRYGTIVHPFLLADNRHYTFYIWRRIINARAWTRYALVPVYATSAFSVIQTLAHEQSAIWIFGWISATCLSLIPSPLLEPRYFLVPYIIMRLYMPKMSSKQVALEFALYGLVNIVTMIVFLYRPFTWSSEPGLQRFMW